MYYAIEIGSSLSFEIFQGLSGSFSDSSGSSGGVLDVQLSSLFIVGESPHRV
jgi:hypothetical protein